MFPLFGSGGWPGWGSLLEIMPRGGVGSLKTALLGRQGQRSPLELAHWAHRQLWGVHRKSQGWTPWGWGGWWWGEHEFPPCLWEGRGLGLLSRPHSPLSHSPRRLGKAGRGLRRVHFWNSKHVCFLSRPHSARKSRAVQALAPGSWLVPPQGSGQGAGVGRLFQNCRMEQCPARPS